MTDAELAEILHCDWPKVVRVAMRDGDAWAKSFALSISRQARRPDWRPSKRQQQIMQRLVGEVRRPPEGEIEVVDDGS